MREQYLLKGQWVQDGVLLLSVSLQQEIQLPQLSQALLSNREDLNHLIHIRRARGQLKEGQFQGVHGRQHERENLN